MKRMLLVVAMLLTANFAAAEALPRKGTFTGYFFVDRWGQGSFDLFFVNPTLTKQLRQDSWQPICVSSNDIRQPMNPGPAMIHHVDKVVLLPKPSVELSLTLDKPSIAFGDETILHVHVTNNSDEPLKLNRRSFYLRTTVHRRGTNPNREIKRDGIYDSSKKVYGDPRRANSVIRATTSTGLFTNDGVIRIHLGVPTLTRKKSGNPVGPIVADQPTIAKHETESFGYSIANGWLINEYELQLQYGSRENAPYILSRPVSFDVGTGEQPNRFRSMQPLSEPCATPLTPSPSPQRRKGS